MSKAAEQETDQMVSLNAIATEIGEKGATGDAILTDLAKGMKEAVATMTSLVGGLVGLAKGQKDDDDEEDDDDTSEESEPGYQNMQLAVPNAHAVGGTPGTPAGNLDATQFLLDTAANLQALVKGQRRLEKENAELRELFTSGVAGLGKAIQQSAEAQLQIAGPLVKAVAEQREALLNIPAPSITGNPRPRPRASDTALIGGNERSEKQALAKAQRMSIIGSDELNHFRKTRAFDPDPAKSAVIRASVERAFNETNPAA